MNSQEAKRLLEVCRPGGADDSDPRFAEALRQTERDPELARWFDAQKAFDSTMAEGVKTVTVPEDLRASILASRRIIRVPIWQDRRARAAVAAIAVALAVTGGLFISRGPTRFADFRTHLIEHAWSGDSHLDFESGDLNRVKQWLAQQNVASDFSLPAGLGEMRLHGCRLVPANGRKIPLVCLGDDLKHVHLFVVNGAEFVGLPPEGAPDFEKCGLWKTASWRQGDKTYVLTGMNYRAFVSKFRKFGRWALSG